MLLYSDSLTGDEMFSDAFPMVYIPSLPFAVLSLLTYLFKQNSGRYRLRGRLSSLIQVKKGADIDIGWFIFSSTAFGPIFEPLVFFFTL